jgi:hypothetical protein
MRYFVPDIRLAMELPEQNRLEEKLGGAPWGLSPEQWPKCSECGKSQSMLAQLCHDTSRLDLKREGRVLFVFQCTHNPGLCSAWEGGSGANACFVLEPEELSAEPSRMPPDHPPIEREARIVGWLEREDGLSPSQAEYFFDDSRWNALREDVRDELFEKAGQFTRLGGVPHWIQSSGEAPSDGWRFAGQLDSLYRFWTPPNLKEQGIRAVKLDAKHPELLSYFCEGPNFGDAGMGYVFIRDTGSAPQGWFFTQCG